MNIEQIRKKYNVPAKTGMVVTVKTGEFAGQRAVILSADKDEPGYLKIRDASGRHKCLWWRRAHPESLEYTQ